MAQIVIVRLFDGTKLERDASCWDRTASETTPVTFRIAPNGDLVLLMFDEVVEAFAAGVWSQVRRDWQCPAGE